MNKREAYELLDTIELFRRPGFAAVRQLGNLEYCVIIKARSYHLFTHADWHAYQQRQENQRKGKELALQAV